MKEKEGKFKKKVRKSMNFFQRKKKILQGKI